MAFLDLVEARDRAAKHMAVITEGLAALNNFVERLGKASLVGEGVQGLQQKDIDAILADLTEKLPALVPGLP